MVENKGATVTAAVVGYGNTSTLVGLTTFAEFGTGINQKQFTDSWSNTCAYGEHNSVGGSGTIGAAQSVRNGLYLPPRVYFWGPRTRSIFDECNNAPPPPPPPGSGGPNVPPPAPNPSNPPYDPAPPVSPPSGETCTQVEHEWGWEVECTAALADALPSGDVPVALTMRAPLTVTPSLGSASASAGTATGNASLIVTVAMNDVVSVPAAYAVIRRYKSGQQRAVIELEHRSTSTQFAYALITLANSRKLRGDEKDETIVLRGYPPTQLIDAVSAHAGAVHMSALRSAPLHKVRGGKDAPAVGVAFK